MRWIESVTSIDVVSDLQMTSKNAHFDLSSTFANARVNSFNISVTLVACHSVTTVKIASVTTVKSASVTTVKSASVTTFKSASVTTVKRALH